MAAAFAVINSDIGINIAGTLTVRYYNMVEIGFFSPYLQENKFIDIHEQILVSLGYDVIRLSYPDYEDVVEDHPKMKVIIFNWFENGYGKNPLSVSNSYVKALFFLKKCHKSGIKVIPIFHNERIHYSSHSRQIASSVFMKIFFGNSDAVITISQNSDKYLSRYRKAKADGTANAFYIPHPNYIGAYPHPSQNCVHSRNKMRVLHFGQIKQYKNTELVIKLAEKFREYDIEFIIAGKVADGECWERISGNAGKLPNVTVKLGFLSDEELGDIVTSADIFILPYDMLNAMNSGVAMLAFSYGKPVICPKICTVLDYPEELNYLYSYENEEDHFAKLEKQLINAYSDWNCSVTISEQGEAQEKNNILFEKGEKLKQIVQEKNSAEAISRKYRDMFEELDIASKKMVFYQPIYDPSSRAKNSGTVIRPRKMKEAFSLLGYEVIDINGSYKNRSEKIKTAIDRGVDFAYWESANSLFCCSGSNRFDINFLCDFFNLIRLRKKVRTGFYYRDIFWAESTYVKEKGKLKGSILKLLFRIEFSILIKLVDILFVQSKEMIASFPNNQKYTGKFRLLPPGCEDRQMDVFNAEGNLKVLYSGAFDNNTKYNISSLIETVSDCDGMSMCINAQNSKQIFDSLGLDKIRREKFCFSENDYDDSDAYNKEFAAGIISLSGKIEDIVKYIPIKLFYYMSLGLPVIAQKGTAAGEFIEQNNIGWTYADYDELHRILDRINEDRVELIRKHENVLQIRADNTWKSRAEYVVKVLSENV